MKVTTDFLAGAIFVAVGIAVAIYSRQYDFGTLSRMGPGFLPTVLGVSIALCGAVIAAKAFRASGPMQSLPFRQIRPVFFVFAGIFIFSLILRRAGLVLSLIALIVVSRMADRKAGLIELAVLVLVLTAIPIVIFVYGLNVNLNLWPE